jgi:hypothetical protein
MARVVASPARMDVVGTVLVFDRDGDVMAFGSEAEAAGYMEAIDVDDGEYDAAYPADGTVLTTLAPDGPDGPVVLTRTDELDRGCPARQDPGLPAS